MDEIAALIQESTSNRIRFHQATISANKRQPKSQGKVTGFDAASNSYIVQTMDKNNIYARSITTGTIAREQMVFLSTSFGIATIDAMPH